MKLAARLILWDIPVWLTYTLVALVLDIIGLVLLAVLSACHAWRWRGSKVFSRLGEPGHKAARWPREVAAWRGGWLTWLWGNEEDGVTGPLWWRIRTANLGAGWWRVAWSAYRWSALRNPSNNLRFIPGINPVLEPARIHSRRGSPYGRLLREWWFCWQGPFAGLWLWLNIRDQLFRVVIGWKIEPGDADGIPDNAPRKVRCGFGVQFKRVG